MEWLYVCWSDCVCGGVIVCVWWSDCVCDGVIVCEVE